MNKPRELSAYEKKQLFKYGLAEADLLTRGELPVEYLTGFVNFKDLDIKVNKNVLIPRVETEELVDLLSDFVSNNLLGKKISYLEIGTGSGAISLAFFDFLENNQYLKLENFVVTDISKLALNLAKENFHILFEGSHLKKIDFLESDLLSNPEIFISRKFNLIVANLPYIPSSNVKKLDLSVRDYEPILALDGGKTGFELIDKMLSQVVEHNLLTNDGKIFLEVYENHTSKFIEDNFPSINDFFSIKEISDQFNNQRFLVLQKR